MASNFSVGGTAYSTNSKFNIGRSTASAFNIGGDAKRSKRENANDPGSDYWARIAIIGDKGVGKSTLIDREITGVEASDDALTSTLAPQQEGINFRCKRYRNMEYLFMLQYWDTSGNHDYAIETARYCAGAAAYILVFDVNDPESFRSLKDVWIPELRRGWQKEKDFRRKKSAPPKKGEVASAIRSKPMLFGLSKARRSGGFAGDLSQGLTGKGSDDDDDDDDDDGDEGDEDEDDAGSVDSREKEDDDDDEIGKDRGRDRGRGAWPPMIIVGNKADDEASAAEETTMAGLGESKRVYMDEATTFAETFHAEYFEVSAKNGSGVADAFTHLTMEIAKLVPDPVDFSVLVDKSIRPVRPLTSIEGVLLRQARRGKEGKGGVRYDTDATRWIL